MSEYFEIPIGDSQLVRKCDCPDYLREALWLWSDCEKEGHDEGCFVVWCRHCDLYSSDCEEDWKLVPDDWK